MLDGAPVVDSAAAVEALVRELPSKIESEFDTPGWTPIAFTDSNGDIILLEKGAPDSSITCVLGRGTLPATPQEVHKLLNTCAFDLRKTYDTQLADMKILEEFGSSAVMYFLYNSPAMMVSKRDFLVLRGNVQEGDVWKHWGHSVNYKDCVPGSGAVRGFSRTMYRLSPKEGNQCVVEYVQLVDPKGWIPTKLVNSQKVTVGERLQKLREAVQALKK
eukprot:PhF_6_TR18119/c0_g1_i1/m.26935